MKFKRRLQITPPIVLAREGMTVYSFFFLPGGDSECNFDTKITTAGWISSPIWVPLYVVEGTVVFAVVLTGAIISLPFVLASSEETH